MVLFYNVLYQIKLKCELLSHVQLFVTPWTAAHQAPLSMGSSDTKESACNASDPGLIPGFGRTPGVLPGNGDSLQYSCLGNPMDRGAWQAIVHGIAKSQT